ncbi:unnamed protein product [Coffea canephora]|uniref:Transmembrane 9 superfamily member n=1 Tax=Coffea canephora TaxID=49390 RepID=A0A068UB66_COFCA|nr:unnamed protein product [Coffea canephora]
MAWFWEILVLVFAIFLMSVAGQVKSDASKHRYQQGDSVPLYGNKVAPFHNPSETHAYYSLPFCRPDPLIEKRESLIEVLNGYHLVSAPYKLDFLIKSGLQVLCRKNLTREEAFQFRTALVQDYFWEMYYDDLPLWGSIGKVDREGKASPEEYKYFIYTRIHFNIFFSGNHVIEILEFSYVAVWKEVNVSFEKRMDKYLKSAHLPRHYRIHEFAIGNALLALLFLIGCLVKICLPLFKKDFYRYTNEEDLDIEETGWKILHGDVFRYPNHKSLLAAAIGSGTQILAVQKLTGVEPVQ